MILRPWRRLRQLQTAHVALQHRWRALWTDHLRRCNCHDSWDQCPCTETGHVDREGRVKCPNRCCAWCSSEYAWEEPG